MLDLLSSVDAPVAQVEAEAFACFDDLGEVDAELAASRRRHKVAARAVRTRNRIEMRRAKAEAELATLLPPVIADGDSWHVMSSGDVDSLSYLQHLMRGEPWHYLLVSTWCMAMQDVEQLAAWLTAGQLQHVDAYTGEILPSQYPTVYEALCTCIRAHAGRVATFRNHSKVMLLANRDTGRRMVVESSANLNTNPRAEQTAVTADAGLFNFYRAYFDGVRSYNGNFADWQPWQPSEAAHG